MTKEQQIEAYTMRLDGLTYEEIGNRLGFTKQHIHQVLVPRPGSEVIKRVVFPNLRKFMYENKLNLTKFTLLCGFRHSQAPYLGKKLKGGCDFKASEIEAILKATRYTYEYAFQKDVINEHE